MFILLGHIPYDGSFVIGLFGSEALAVQGRAEFRQRLLDAGQAEPFDLYSIYEMDLNVLDGQIFNRVPVNTFHPKDTVKATW